MKNKNKTRRKTAADWREQIRVEIDPAYQSGLKDGKHQAAEAEDKKLQRESLKARIELGRAYAAVFEGITRSAAMFLDGGSNAFR